MLANDCDDATRGARRPPPRARATARSFRHSIIGIRACSMLEFENAGAAARKIRLALASHEHAARGSQPKCGQAGQPAGNKYI